MGNKSMALAKQLEAKVQEAMATLEKLNDHDWKKVTEAEKWSVGVTAHHLAGALEPVSRMVEALVAGRSPKVTIEKLDEMNAKHAEEQADCTKAETLKLLKKGSSIAVAVIRDLSDEQLAKSGPVIIGVPPMSAEQLIKGALLDHIDIHLGSIQKAVYN